MSERLLQRLGRRLAAVLGRRHRDQGGTILLMVPAGLLVMIMLGAIAFDLSLAYAGERRIADLAAVWANDALGALDLDTFYDEGQEVALDQDAAFASVMASWAALDDPSIILPTAPIVAFPDAVTIIVTINGEIPLLFLDGVPGVEHRNIGTTSTARLVVTG